MRRIVIFGNSGSGKSTLARELCSSRQLAHLDLDTLAWTAGTPPERRPVEDSTREIERFLSLHSGWVIEGCYADLIELVLGNADEVIFLDLPVEQCIANAKRRPWEPHKYESKEAQDDNLTMLLEWISRYPVREDNFSRAAHRALYDAFVGTKKIYTSNEGTARQGQVG